MDHLKILLALINLIIGIWVIFYLVLINKRLQLRFLPPLIKYTVVYNLIILMLLLSKYTSINLPADFPLNRFPLMDDLLQLLFFILSMGLFYFLTGIIAGFNNQSISRRLKFVLFLAFGSMILIHSINILFKYLGSKITLFDQVYQLILDNIILGEAILLFWLVIFYRRWFPADKHRIIQSFGYFYLLRYIFIFIIILFPSLFVDYQLLRILALMGFFLLLNTIPLIWVKFFLLKYSQLILPDGGQDKIFHRFCLHYGISQREEEIVKLLLQGSSNKQIEDALFISPHTVKNHIYHIFKKLAVSSRYQLINRWTIFSRSGPSLSRIER